MAYAARKRDELYCDGRVLRQDAGPAARRSGHHTGRILDRRFRPRLRCCRREPLSACRAAATSGSVEPVFMFTGERPDPAKNPRAEFARMLTSHPQFARTAVNLLWAEMFGVGIVDPPLDFDLARIDPMNPPPAGLDSAADASGVAGSSRPLFPRK